MLLEDALVASGQANDPYAERLSFAVPGAEPALAFRLDSISSLNCVSLDYSPGWPLNIVIDPQALSTYNKVFGLMVRVKRANWALGDVHIRLKRWSAVAQSSCAVRFRQLQAIRHEMQHFVSVISSYLAHQVRLRGFGPAICLPLRTGFQ